MSDDDKLHTAELERLGVLAEAVRGLRQELVAYRWTLERWMRRGSRAAVALGVLVLLTTVAATGAVWAAVSSGRALDEMRRSEVQHRERNELLHGCLVELVLDIVRSEPEQRGSVTNPCPSPLPPDELSDG